jgi:integrase
MRRGEISGTGPRAIGGLRWSNILWMDRIIRIEDSKNGDPREIPFTAEIETMLQAQFAKRQEGCDRVCFRLDRKGDARPIGNFRKVWSRVCVKLGLGKMEPVVDKAGNPVFEPQRYKHSRPRPKLRYSGLLLHDLRRTFVSDAEHSGAPRHEVMQMTGHRTESVYRRYAISDRENRRAALDQIAAYRAQKFGDTTGTVSTKTGQDDSVVN